MKNKSTIQNPISERLLKKISDRGLTVYELAKRTGHAAANVNVAKTRKNSYSTAKMLYDFAQVLGTTTDYLISGKESALDRDKMIQQLIKEKIEYKTKYEDLRKRVGTLLVSDGDIMH